MLDIVGILLLDQNVCVVLAIQVADVKPSLTGVKTTLVLMEELVLVLEDISYVIVQ